MSDELNIKKDALESSMSSISDAISHAVTGALSKLGEKPLTDEEKETKARTDQKMDKKEKWERLFATNGIDEVLGKTCTLKQMAQKAKELAASDAVNSGWYRNLIPNIVSNIIREPIEMGAPLTGLLTPVRFQNGTSISFPAVGPAGNLDLDMGEGEEYPDFDLDVSGSVTLNIGKSGIAVSFTEEALRYQAFDVVGLHMRQAYQALKRHKEAKAANMIYSLGTTFIDNAVSGAGKTHGRDINGNFNHTLIVDDLIDASVSGIQEGWYFDTIVINPLAWPIFAKDPILREQFFRGIAGGSFWQKPIGQAASFPELGVNSPYGGNVGPSTALGATSGTNLGASQAATLSFQVPQYGGLGFNVIVSPYAPISYDATLGKYVTDIVMLQAEHAGLLVIDEEVTPDQWTDPTVDVHKMKLRERYALGQLHAGAAARVIKNVVIDRAYFMEDKVTWDVANGALDTAPGILNPSSSAAASSSSA